MLKAENITVRYGEHTVLDHLSFHLEEGQWLMLAGPNGAGKSTLIETISQGVPYTGSIQLDGRDIRRFRPTQLARRIGVLAQKNTVGYAYTVEEVVGLGRYAHTSGFLSARDDGGKDRVEQALEMTGLNELRHANVLTLSGGELQRTFLAQLFAQDPKLLMLDEPTNHLDLVYQKQVFALVKDWLRETGGAVISVVHDLSLAKAYGTHALLMEKGHIVSAGAVEDVMTPEHLNKVYSMDVARWMRELYGQWQEDNTP